MTRVAPDGTAYDLTGPADAPVLALIHGLGLSRHLWDRLLPDFADYRVVRYDLPGHGESAALDQPATLGRYADQLARLKNHLGIARAHVIGFSIGGMINRRFALDYPEKTASLVILNAPHDRGAAAQKAVEARAEAARIAGSSATMDAALARWFTAEALANSDAPGRVRAWRERADPRSYADAAWVLAHGVRELTLPDPAITVPTLVMTCADDVGSTPDMSRAIANSITGATTRIVPGLKHLGLMERPTEFTGPIKTFLLNQERPSSR